MRLIGVITMLQIQQAPLKQGSGLDRVYDPTPVLPVAALRLTSRGVKGILTDQIEVIDVHHIDHPQSRNRGNTNGISFGFLSSYARIRQRFQQDILDGCGGENLLIDPVSDFSLDVLHTHLIIRPQDATPDIVLHDIMVAAPCEPFTRFVAQSPIGGVELKQALQFLSDGTRGFYATLTLAQTEPTIRPGDAVYAILEGETSPA